MKNCLIYFFILVGLFGFMACEDSALGDCFQSTGSIRTEERFLAEIKSIELDDRINLFLTFSEDDEYQIRVKAGKNLLDGITTSVEQGNLLIKNENKCNWVRSFDKEMDVFITLPDLDLLTYRGSGEIKFMNELKTDSFLLESWNASGNLSFQIDASYLGLKLNTGPANVNCSGKASQLVAFSNGLGRLDAKGVAAERVLAINENIGSIAVSADTFLQAEIKGSGDIEYYGSPQIQLEQIGSGQLIS